MAKVCAAVNGLKDETTFRFYCRMVESLGGTVPVYTPEKQPGLIARMFARKRVRVGPNFEPAHVPNPRSIASSERFYYVDGNGSVRRISPKRDKSVSTRQARILHKRRRRELGKGLVA